MLPTSANDATTVTEDDILDTHDAVVHDLHVIEVEPESVSLFSVLLCNYSLI